MKKFLFTAVFAFLASSQVEACTAFQLKSQDGAYVYCRSLEFGLKLDSNLLIVGRGTDFQGTAPDGQPGLVWKTKYGYAGMNQFFESDQISDGMNEKGLVVGALYFPGYARFEDAEPTKNNRTIAPWEFIGYILGNCGTMNDVIAIIPTITVAHEVLPNTNFYLPLHYFISDQEGNSLVVEYVDGQRNVYNNPANVFTNSPQFDWHLTNLGNYVNLSPNNVSELSINNYQAKSFGQGSGLLGLPGDYTPPSRFVRAALFSNWALPQPTALETVRLGFHILNTFDIFQGIVRSNEKPPKGIDLSHFEKADITEWVIVHDKKNLKTYFRTYGSLEIQSADFKRLDFSKAGFQQIPLNNAFVVRDVTGQVKSINPRL
jgi:choloylglycine hydrolase